MHEHVAVVSAGNDCTQRFGTLQLPDCADGDQPLPKLSIRHRGSGGTYAKEKDAYDPAARIWFNTGSGNADILQRMGQGEIPGGAAVTAMAV